VVSASNFFLPWNNKVLPNPKTELIIQDGRAHLELTKRKYDVIISEPSNPWMAGLASLFTKEFFLLAKKRLKEDGLFVQFFHSYQMNWPTFALVGRTFSQAFPHSLLVNTFPGDGDYLMIGFKGGKGLVLENDEKRISYARQSNNITLTDLRVLYKLVVSEDLQKLCGPGPVHSDNWPLLEYAAPKQMYTEDPNIGINTQSKRWLSQETRNILQEIADVNGQIAFANFALSCYKPFPKMVDLSKATPDQKNRFFTVMEDYCARSLIKDYSIFTDKALKERCLSTQIETMENNIHRLPNKAVAYNRLGNTYYTKGDFRAAIECYQKAFTFNPNFAEAHYNLGLIFDEKGRIDEAIAEYKRAITINPQYVSARVNLGADYSDKGRLDEAIFEYKKALTIDPNIIAAHHNLAAAYYYKGNYRSSILHCDKAVELGGRVNPKLLELLKPYR